MTVIYLLPMVRSLPTLVVHTLRLPFRCVACCRESADPSRIRDRHRKMLMLNHPDTGGSTFIASKINEAKDVLIKGKAAS